MRVGRLISLVVISLTLGFVGFDFLRGYRSKLLRDDTQQDTRPVIVGNEPRFRENGRRLSISYLLVLERARDPSLVLPSDLTQPYSSRELTPLCSLEERCVEFLAKEPENLPLRQFHAALLDDIGQFEAALREIDIVTRQGRLGRTTHEVRAQILASLNRREEAEQEQLLAFDADNREEDWESESNRESSAVRMTSYRDNVLLVVGPQFVALVVLCFWRGQRQQREAGGTKLLTLRVSILVAGILCVPTFVGMLTPFPNVFWYFGPVERWLGFVIAAAMLRAFLVMSVSNFTYLGKTALPECVDSGMVDRVRRLAEALGVRTPKVRVQSTVQGLDAASVAFVGGLAPPSIVLYDQVLTQLAPDEQDAVVAHELAHLKQRFGWCRIILGSAEFTVLIVLAIHWGAFAKAACFSLLLSQLVLRHFRHWAEFDADRRASRITSPDAMARGLHRLLVTHPLTGPGFWLSVTQALGTHPTLAERLRELAKLSKDSHSVEYCAQMARFDRRVRWGTYFVMWACWAVLTWASPLRFSEWDAALYLLLWGVPFGTLSVAMNRSNRIAQAQMRGSKKSIAHRFLLVTGSLLLVVSAIALASSHKVLPSLSMLGALFGLFATLVGMNGIRIGSQSGVLITAALQQHNLKEVRRLASEHRETLLKKDPQALYSAALAAYGLGDEDSAKRELEALSERFPNLLAVKIALVTIAADEQQTERALSLLDEIEPQLHSHDLMRFALRSACYRQQQRFDESIELCLQALKLRPHLPVFLAALSILDADRGRYAESERYLSEAESLLPNDPSVRCARAERAIRQHDVDSLATEIAALEKQCLDSILLIHSRVARFKAKLSELYIPRQG